MPLPVENLTKDSSADSIREAVSASISQCMDEGGREHDECVAMSLEIARRKTGKALGKGQSRIRQGMAAEEGS